MSKSEHAIVYPAGSLLLREFVGDAADSEGREFELSLLSGFIPAVKCMATGRTWSISWQGLIDLAIADGLCNADRSLHHFSPPRGTP